MANLKNRPLSDPFLSFSILTLCGSFSIRFIASDFMPCLPDCKPCFPLFVGAQGRFKNPQKRRSRREEAELDLPQKSASSSRRLQLLESALPGCGPETFPLDPAFDGHFIQICERARRQFDVAVLAVEFENF